MSRDYRVVAEALFVERASADAVKALRQAGVRPILLKGPLQQWWLEPGGSARASVDVDVLVQHSDFQDAEAALGTIGYSRAVGLPDEAGLEHSTAWGAQGRVPVELHWSLLGADQGKVWNVLASQTEIAFLAGEEVEIPNEAARCTIVAMHAAQHGIGESAIFHDLERALVIADSGTWQRAFELARALNGWTPFAGALSLTTRGRELLAEFGAEPPVLNERQALSLLTPAPTSRGFYFLGRERGASAKAAFLLKKLAPSPEFMRLRYPIAHHQPGGLVIAYLYRPLWLMRWSLPGLRSWHRAKRLAKASGASASEHDQHLESHPTLTPPGENGHVTDATAE